METHNDRNILVIDSSELIAKALGIKLEQAGFKVHIAYSAKEVYEYFEEKFFDFFGVIVEIDLPDVDDPSKFIDYLSSKHVATVILSSLDDENFISKITQKPIIDYITKAREEDLDYAVDMLRRIYRYRAYKVLIVDDSKIARDMAKRNLQSLKLKVLTAEDGLEALEVMKSHKDIKLILTDYNMPRMNGFELTLTLRKKYSKEELLIVAITAADNEKISSMFLKYGANGYVDKKCSKEELNYTINNLMDVLENKYEANRVKHQIEDYMSKLSRYVSPQIYNNIVSKKKETVEPRRKKLTIAFIHIANFTDVSESFESEELTYWLNSYLTVVSEIVIKYGATIDKFIGDAVMLFFGAPHSDGVQEDALKCVKMSIEIQQAMKDFREHQRKEGILKLFHAKIGISTGFVTVGNFGNSQRMDYTIIGGFVNLAARIEYASKEGEILIPEETYSLVSKFIKTQKHEQIKAKGFANLIQTYKVLRLKNEKELSDESNDILKNVLGNIDRSHVEIDEYTLQLLCDINGLEDTRKKK